LLEASKEFNIPEIILLEAIHDAPSILERFTYGKERYISFFQAAFLRHIRRDNVVYHGLAGQFFLKGISHALKVRVITDMEDRVRSKMLQEEISREQALRTIKGDDEERRKWSRNLYGIDTADPALYDVVIRLRKITVGDAADIICHTAGLAIFQTTFESQKAMDDLVLAAEIKAALVDIKPDIQVHVKEGNVVIGGKVSPPDEQQMIDEMGRIARNIAGVNSVEIRARHAVDWTE
ncbi:MAG: cytidylate kinase family protein, partial [Desulforhabdus sp.]|nr:cytidylate kinase family protein [Desulforhabdus sp.]